MFEVLRSKMETLSKKMAFNFANIYRLLCHNKRVDRSTGLGPITKTNMAITKCSFIQLLASPSSIFFEPYYYIRGIC